MEDIAVVGYALRFPEADNADEFWENLMYGVDSINHVGDIPKTENFVNSYGRFQNLYAFDADFFGISKRDVVNMDPQQRYLIMLCQEGLEHANYKVSNNPKVGVFSGIGDFFYVWKNLFDEFEDLETARLLNTSFLDGTATLRASYTLGLTGPSIPVKNACASSLVAIHLAMQSLQRGECDAAIAGGISIQEYQEGYITAEGTLSPTGSVRPFDQYADGFVPGNGGGVIVLKRLGDAQDAGDYIHAVIKGSAITNDGKEKSGYSAPSVQGESGAIEEAVKKSGLFYSDISYVEIHGTATQLGDVIEAEALKKTYGSCYKHMNQVLYVGSVKSNVGHLNYAAGIAGVIKTILMLKHRKLVPTIYYQQENKKLQLGDSNIVVNRFCRDWNRRHLVAGVSSFGIGGVNCHLIMEEYDNQETMKANEQTVIIPLSGKTRDYVIRYGVSLKNYIEKHPQSKVEDIAMTLQTGREFMQYRAVVVAKNIKELRKQLDSALIVQKAKKSCNMYSVYMFGGSNRYEKTQIEQLIQSDNSLKAYFHEIFQVVYELFSLDLELELQQEKWSSFGQYMLHFCVQYALGEYLSSMGVEPQAVMGYSAGEYMAAYFAGIFTLEDTLRICAKRYSLFEQMEDGAMVSVMARYEKIEKLLNGQVEVVAYNAPGRIMVAGLTAPVRAFCEELEKENILHVLLPLNRAGHCCLVDKILPDLRTFLHTITFYEPEIDYYSTSLGRHVEIDEITTVDYWVNQTRNHVLFQQTIENLKEKEDVVGIEIGVGEQLCSFFNKAKRNQSQMAISLVTEKYADCSEALKQGLGNLWSLGCKIPWEKLRDGVGRKIGLPTTVFDLKEYKKENHGVKYMARNQMKEIWNGFRPEKMELCRYLLNANEPIKVMTIQKNNLNIIEYEQSWKQLESSIVNNSDILCMAQMEGLYDVYDGICLRVASDYFKTYGLFLQNECTVTEKELFEKTGCIQAYKVLMQRLLGFMEKAGYIVREHQEWYIIQGIQELESVDQYVKGKVEKFPEFTYFFELLCVCSRNYPEVLSGKILGKEVLYPNGSYDYVRQVFDRTPTYGKSNLYANIFSEILEEIAKKKEGVLRILEVGAGSGIVTWPAMERLKNYDVEYFFTDIGYSFIYDAKKRAKDSKLDSHMYFQKLDVNQSLEKQSIPTDYFDIVVSCGMIQSVPDMEVALEHMKEAMRADGILCLLQPIGVHGIRELFGGLTPEWWNYTKDPIRSKDYNISISAWKELFLKHGFDSFFALEGDEKNITDSAIIMGQLSYADYERTREQLFSEYGDLVKEQIVSEPRVFVPQIKMEKKHEKIFENETERQLAELISNITEEENIDFDKSLFELDIDSLTGLMLVTQINEKYQIKITPKEMIVCSSLRELGNKINDKIQEREENVL